MTSLTKNKHAREFVRGCIKTWSNPSQVIFDSVVSYVILLASEKIKQPHLAFDLNGILSKEFGVEVARFTSYGKFIASLTMTLQQAQHQQPHHYIVVDVANPRTNTLLVHLTSLAFDKNHLITIRAPLIAKINNLSSKKRNETINWLVKQVRATPKIVVKMVTIIAATIGILVGSIQLYDRYISDEKNTSNDTIQR